MEVEKSSLGEVADGESELIVRERHALLGEKLRIAFGTTVDNKQPDLRKALEIFYRSVFDPNSVLTTGIDDNDKRFSDRIAVLGSSLSYVGTNVAVDVPEFVNLIYKTILGMDLHNEVVRGATELIDKLKKCDCTWGVWTGGNPEWQKAKLRNCGLFDDIEPIVWVHPIKEGSFGDDMNLDKYRRVIVIEDMPKYIDEAHNRLGQKGMYFRVVVGRHGVGEDRKECKSAVTPKEIVDLNDVVKKIVEEEMGRNDLVIIDFDGVLVNDAIRWLKTAKVIEQEMIERGWVTIE